MFYHISTLLIQNGLLLVLSSLEIVNPAPLINFNISKNSSLGRTNFYNFSESKKSVPNPTHPKELHLLKISPLFITDGQSLQEKQTVVNYLSALEEKVERENKIPTPRTSDDQAIPYVFEEDIILTPQQAQLLYESRNSRQKRKMHTDLKRHWEQHVPIQYAFDGTHNESEKKIIKSALHYWESYTCIQFEEIGYKDNASINDNQVYIVFTNNEGCWSFVGRSPSTEQKVSIYDDCVYEGHVIHEIGHVIGFWHEHARPDREEHISVKTNSIKIGKQYNFLHISWKDLDTKDMPYDVGSIMHYGSTAYHVNNVDPIPPTILTKDPRLQRAIGQRYQLSFYDVKLANSVYCADECNKTHLSQPCLHEGYQDPKYCTRCRCTEGLGGTYCDRAAPSVGVMCGGTIDVTGVNQTIGFPQAYNRGQRCNWYLKAPNNTRIFLTIESSEIMDYYGCQKSPYVECMNYVEVRYAHNIAKTGARYCCSFLESTAPIISESNEMLVLMRANTHGLHGFQAKVWAESCGGCVTGTESSHTPCSRRVSHRCERQWTYTEWNPCPSGHWIWGDKNCNKMINKTGIRDGICYKNEIYCCNGYELKGSICIKSTAIVTTSIVIPPDNYSTIYTVPTNNPPGNRENDPYLGWGNWTSWSNCSELCGGCGNQTRQRICMDAQFQGCNGKLIEFETQPCNTNPCTTVSFGTRTISKVVVCNPLTLEKCTIYTKESYPYISESCCDGYVKNSTSGQCEMDAT